MLELDFLPVGTSNGDAICVRYGDANQGYYLNLIDGGYTDTSKTIINHIRQNYGSWYHINHMVLSHADNDHAMGLVGVMEQVDVKHLWMNRPWLYAAETLERFHGNYTLNGLIRRMRDLHPYLVRLEELALEKGTIIHEVFQGSQIGAFHVLAPSRKRYIDLIPDLDKTPTPFRDSTESLLAKALMEAAAKWVEERWNIETLSNNPTPPTSASNETSVVQHALIDRSSVLLTADVGPIGLMEAANYAQAIGRLTPPTHVQVPHHGSRHNVTPDVLDRWLGPISVQGTFRGNAYCSVGSDKPSYPRGQVKNAFMRRGYKVHATRTSSVYGYSGTSLRSGWTNSTPETFDDQVEL